mmetsp:Transcript_23495/g.49192  ORF Transcript_23495/g.49192 Transcript_23495/m.49192 type:complete len:270 (+) Transcript_23495:2535-3344(+)
MQTRHEHQRVWRHATPSIRAFVTVIPILQGGQRVLLRDTQIVHGIRIQNRHLGILRFGILGLPNSKQIFIRSQHHVSATIPLPRTHGRQCCIVQSFSLRFVVLVSAHPIVPRALPIGLHLALQLLPHLARFVEEQIVPVQTNHHLLRGPVANFCAATPPSGVVDGHLEIAESQPHEGQDEGNDERDDEVGPRTTCHGGGVSLRDGEGFLICVGSVDGIVLRMREKVFVEAVDVVAWFLERRVLGVDIGTSTAIDDVTTIVVCSDYGNGS